MILEDSDNNSLAQYSFSESKNENIILLYSSLSGYPEA